MAGKPAACDSEGMPTRDRPVAALRDLEPPPAAAFANVVPLGRRTLHGELVERLRDQGLGVVLISHNMADVQAVADRIVVMRLGRNAAEFRTTEVTTEQLVAAITGASDNVVAARAGRHALPAELPVELAVEEDQ